MARKKRETGAAQGDSAGEPDKLNKTKAVKEYMAQHPRAKPKKIAEDLTKQYGIEFKPTAVSTIKHQLKKSGALKGRRGPRRQQGAGAANRIDISELVAAKKMAERLGGVEKTRQILDVLAQLG